MTAGTSTGAGGGGGGEKTGQLKLRFGFTYGASTEEVLFEVVLACEE